MRVFDSVVSVDLDKLFERVLLSVRAALQLRDRSLLRDSVTENESSSVLETVLEIFSVRVFVRFLVIVSSSVIVVVTETDTDDGVAVRERFPRPFPRVGVTEGVVVLNVSVRSLLALRVSSLESDDDEVSPQVRLHEAVTSDDRLLVPRRVFESDFDVLFDRVPVAVSTLDGLCVNVPFVGVLVADLVTSGDRLLDEESVWDPEGVSNSVNVADFADE
jgi:hypothetical protein